MLQEEKDEILGVILQMAAKNTSQAAFIAARHAGIPDADLRANPWYAWPQGSPVPVDDYVTCLGIPAGLYLGSKLIKRQDRRAKLKGMAEGAAYAGIAVLVDHLVGSLPKYGLPPVGEANPLNIDMSFPSTNVIHQANIGPWPANQESALPWQRNLEW